MKKFLKIIGIILLTIVGLFLIVNLVGDAKLAFQGFNSQEREMIRFIKMSQTAVERAIGRNAPTFESFSHVSEVLDEDGTTLLGYYIDGKMEGAAIGKRYFFTKEKQLLWWTNQTPDADEQGRQHLKEGKGW